MHIPHHTLHITSHTSYMPHVPYTHIPTTHTPYNHTHQTTHMQHIAHTSTMHYTCISSCFSHTPYTYPTPSLVTFPLGKAEAGSRGAGVWPRTWSPVAALGAGGMPWGSTSVRRRVRRRGASAQALGDVYEGHGRRVGRGCVRSSSGWRVPGPTILRGVCTSVSVPQTPSWQGSVWGTCACKLACVCLPSCEACAFITVLYWSESVSEESLCIGLAGTGGGGPTTALPAGCVLRGRAGGGARVAARPPASVCACAGDAAEVEGATAGPAPGRSARGGSSASLGPPRSRCRRRHALA